MQIVGAVNPHQHDITNLERRWVDRRQYHAVAVVDFASHRMAARADLHGLAAAQRFFCVCCPAHRIPVERSEHALERQTDILDTIYGMRRIEEKILSCDGWLGVCAARQAQVPLARRRCRSATTTCPPDVAISPATSTRCG